MQKIMKRFGVLSMIIFAAVLTLSVSAMAEPLDFSSTGGLSVDPVDAVTTGWSFMSMFDAWTMLVLGLIIAPVAIGFVIWIMRKLPRFGGSRS